MFHDWRFLIILYLILTGVWGVVAKVSASRLNPFTATFIGVTSCWIVVTLASFSRLQLGSKVGIAAAITCGIISGVGALAFYGALKNAPAGIIIPLSSLYVVITVVLAHFLLGETIGLRQAAGIVLGIISIVLLVK
jgi:uncharacterized membrane protein